LKVTNTSTGPLLLILALASVSMVSMDRECLSFFFRSRQAFGPSLDSAWNSRPTIVIENRTTIIKQFLLVQNHISPVPDRQRTRDPIYMRE